MELLGKPRGLILFSSQRLWPHLDALAQWGDHLDEVRVVVAHGDDEERGPVTRLENFLTQHLPHVTLQRLGPINDDDPEAALEAVTLAASDDKQWLIDVSGGTRLTFVGGLTAARALNHVRVVYREADGPWYQIGTQAGQTRQLDGVNTRATDRFTVEGLLGVTWSEGSRQPRVLNTVVEPEIQTAAAAALSRPGDWRRVFERAVTQVGRRTRQKPSAGRLFERFVIALIREMGVAADDVAVGVELVDGNKTLQEVDVVVNSNGWLHVIDCKLTDTEITPEGRRVKAPPLGTQIREAFTTKRLLGDGGDQYVFLRPYLPMSLEFRSLCDEYGLHVVDKTVLARDPLPVVLQRLLHPPPPTHEPA